MVGTPWLPYYAVAASFMLFGESAWSARLLFAVAGLATLVLTYALVRRASEDRRAAMVSAILPPFST
jgi:4-amino-4-deoxy-L-arabinose transferase-like glycosyltransferase